MQGNSKPSNVKKKQGAPFKPIDKKFSGGKMILNMSGSDAYLIACTAKTLKTTQQRFMRNAVIEYIEGTQFRLVFDPVARGEAHKHRIVLGESRAGKRLIVEAARKSNTSTARFVREIVRGKCLQVLGAEKYNAALERYARENGIEKAVEFVADLGEPGQVLRLTPAALGLRKPCAACGETIHLKEKKHSFVLWCDSCREVEISKLKEMHKTDDKAALDKAADIVGYRMQGNTLQETGEKFGVSKQRINQIEKWFLGAKPDAST